MFSALILLAMVARALHACATPAFAETPISEAPPPVPGALDAIKQRDRGLKDAMPSMLYISPPGVSYADAGLSWSKP